jgi:hypothetical protein
MDAVYKGPGLNSPYNDLGIKLAKKIAADASSREELTAEIPKPCWTTSGRAPIEPPRAFQKLPTGQL